MSGSEGKKVPYRVQIGPTHPALKEPVMFTFELEGEMVREVDFAPGQTHRGIEWMGLRRNPVHIVHLTDRVCGICGVVHSLSFARAVEQIAEIEVPERADYIRSIIAEFERIQSHLLWAGVAAHELGFDSLLHLTWRVREQAMDVIENLTGNRVNYGMVQVGGVRRDIVPDQHKIIEDCLATYEGLLGKLLDLFLHDRTIAMRCRDTGVLSYDDALKLCTVGPTARASGVNVDLRQDYPYCAYGDLDIRAILPDQHLGETRGDVYDRIVVRLLEVGHSCTIVGISFSAHLPSNESLEPLFIPTDFSEIKGQDHVKRALEVSAAGGHNVLMAGSPGSGKTLLARALPGILPEMSIEESLDVTRIFSVADTPRRHAADQESTVPFAASHHQPCRLGRRGQHPKAGGNIASTQGCFVFG